MGIGQFFSFLLRVLGAVHRLLFAGHDALIQRIIEEFLARSSLYAGTTQSATSAPGGDSIEATVPHPAQRTGGDGAGDVATIDSPPAGLGGLGPIAGETPLMSAGDSAGLEGGTTLSEGVTSMPPSLNPPATTLPRPCHGPMTPHTPHLHPLYAQFTPASCISPNPHPTHPLAPPLR